MLRILVAEDDDDTLRYLQRGLGELGHIVEVAADGREALFQASAGGFDVIVLDRLLPIMDGMAVLRSLRDAAIATPVLMLTALSRVEDKVDGLEAGADDYLVKPFAFSELTARLNALARRPVAIVTDTVLRAGPLEFDLLRREARRGGKRVDLQARELAVLEQLMRNAGRVMTRTMLLERVWNFHFDPKTNIVETHVSRLRAKLNAGFEGDLIQTVRGAGYMISADG